MSTNCIKRITCLLVCALFMLPNKAMSGYDTLKIGDKGEAVLKMQQSLSLLGYALKEDGIFGRGTQSAVCAFQRDQGLRSDGKAGNQTLSRLYGTQPAAFTTHEPATITPTAAPTPLALITDGEYATVEGGRLKLRTFRSSSSAWHTIIPDKARVVVTKRGDTWCAVAYGKYSGFVLTKFLTFDNTVIPALLEASPTPEITVTPAPKSEAGQAVVSTPSGPLNMRKSARSSAVIVTKIPNKAAVTVLAYEEKWAKVTYKNYTGYVNCSFLTDAGKGGTKEASIRLYPGLPITPVRIEASEDADIIDQMNSNSVFTILSRGKEWTKIRYGEDETGYVLTSSLKPESREETESSPSRYSFTYAVLKSDQPVYREALSSAAITGSMKKGAAVEVYYIIGSWGNVSDGSIQGWVKVGAIDFDNVNKSDAAAEVINAEAAKRNSGESPGLFGTVPRGTPTPRKSYDGMEEISKDKAASIGATALASKFEAFAGPNAYTVQASYHDNEFTQFEQPYWQFNYVASRDGFPQLTAVKFIVMVHAYTQKVIYIIQGWESDLTEIDYSTPTPAPVYSDEEKANSLSKSEALSIGQSMLTDKYSAFTPSAYTISIRYVETSTAFEAPYWQIDYLDSRGGVEYSIYVHAYTRKMLYTYAPGGGNG